MALENIPKSNRLIPLLTILLIRILRPRHPLPYPIDPRIIPPQRHHSAQPDAHKRQFECVPQYIFRRILRAIEIARHGSRQIADADMDRHASGALITTRKIIRDPGDVARKGGIDAADGDEDPGVDDAGDAAVGGGGDADDEAGGDDAHEGEDVRGALTGAVREPGDGDGEHGGGDVDGDREELGGGGGVAQFADDAGEEERDAVEGADDAPVHCMRYGMLALDLKDKWGPVNWAIWVSGGDERYEMEG